MAKHRKNKVEELEELNDSPVATLEANEETVPETNLEEVEVMEIKESPEATPVESSVNVLDKYYSRLFSSGSLVAIHISRWGMSVKLNENDLKIEKVPDIIRLGKKMLIKPVLFNQFSQIEQKARNYLKRISREFPIAQAHFVAAKNLKEVRDQLDAFKEEFNILKANFIKNYEANKNEALAAYPEYREVLEPYYPPVGQLDSKFSFDYSEFRITMPTEFEKVDLHVLLAEEEKVNEIATEAQARYEAQVQKQLAEVTKFVDESIKELRDGMGGVFSVIVNKINKGEVVSDTNKKTLLREIEKFEKMNIWGDKAMADQIASVKALIHEDRDFKDKDNAEDRNVLKDYLLNAMTVAQNTSDISNLTGEYFRALEI